MSANTINEAMVQRASPRQWIRLGVTYLLVPVLLFICGGDLLWWQAWVYNQLIVTAGIGARVRFRLISGLY